MQLTDEARNVLLDTLTDRLNGGSLVIYAGSQSSPTELVRMELPSPAFLPASSGVMVGTDWPDSPIRRDGDAAWAELVSGAGQRLLILTVGPPGRADVVPDKLALEQGAVCRLRSVALSIPARL